jgi:predicted RNA-binding protein with PIN domain
MNAPTANLKAQQHVIVAASDARLQQVVADKNAWRASIFPAPRAISPAI